MREAGESFDIDVAERQGSQLGQAGKVGGDARAASRPSLHTQLVEMRRFLKQLVLLLSVKFSSHCETFGRTSSSLRFPELSLVE